MGLIDNDQKRRIYELRAKGKSFAKIANEVGVSKQSVVDICKEGEEKVATLKALELEELYEAQQITIEQRLTAHASLLQRLRNEIESRDLTDIPTEKLVDLYLKTASTIKEEFVTPNFQSTEEQQRDQKERKYLNSLSSV